MHRIKSGIAEVAQLAAHQARLFSDALFNADK